MKQSVNFSTFQMAFESLRPNNFTYEGLTVLFDGLEQLEQDTDSEMDLDVIALCCEFCEMTELEIREAYDLENSDSSTQFLQDRTLVLGSTDTSVIFAQF